MENLVMWGSLPPKKRGKGRPLGARRHAQIEILKANPGKWALLDVYDKQGTASGTAATLGKRHGLEVATRKNDDGQYGLWARWNNDNKEN